MAGDTIDVNVSPLPQQESINDDKMTKERFDAIVGAFIKKRGNIKKVDFIK